jgi:amidohydrolase
METDPGRAEFGAQILEEAEKLRSDLQEWRRDLHQFPELAFEEHITSSKIMRVLEATDGIDVVQGFAMETCVIGVIRGDLEGPAIVLRTCIDALGIEEETGLPFASCIPGIMHAGGNDAHIASLLGAAKLLAKHKDELKHKIVLLFQPAGEGRGGAKLLLQNKFIEKYNVGSCYCVNWWPQFAYGEILTKKGVVTALSDKIHIDIRGVAGHGGTPHKTVDPVMIAAHILIAVQTMLTREVDPRNSVVVSFGHIEAGLAYNAIPEQANIWGTLRAFDPKTRDFVQERIETVVPAIAKAFRGLASVEYTRNYGQVENDSSKVRELYKTAEPFFGADAMKKLEQPRLWGDDFSFLSSCVPSVFMLLGTGFEYALHNSKYDTPESMLPFAAAWEAYMALTL